MPLAKPGARPAPAAASPAPAAVRPRPGPTAAAAKPNGAAAPVAAPVIETAPAALATGYEVKETVLEVMRRYPGGEPTTETLEIRTFATRTGSISVSNKQRLGTVGQGAEVSVMVTVPHYMEEQDEAYAEASAKVAEYLALEQERLAELAGPEALAQAGIGLDGEGLPEAGTGEGEAEAGGEGEAETAGEVNADYVRALPDEAAVLAFCQENGCEITLEEYSTLDEAKEAVISYFWSEDAGEGEEQPPAEETAATGYTEAELSKMKLSELTELFGAWGVNGGKAPGRAKGVGEADHKKRLVSMVIKFQEDAVANAAAG